MFRKGNSNEITFGELVRSVLGSLLHFVSLRMTVTYHSFKKLKKLLIIFI